MYRRHQINGLLRKLLTILMLSMGSLQVVSQPYEIFGKVVNKTTSEAVPFANIAIKDIYKGTASNLLGEFSFKVDSLPLTLVISHLSFESTEIVVLKSEELTIELTPGQLLMSELVIQGSGNRQYAYSLLRNAYYRILGKGRSERYGKAFYRQISKNSDEYSELYEVFYDTKYSNNGVEDWAIQEGRYALKLSGIDSFIYNKNFTQMVRLLTVVQPKTEDLIMPISELVEDQFDLTMEKILSVNGRKLAVIRFKKRQGISFPALEGEVSVDVDTYDVYKLKGEIADDNLNFISLSGKRGSWKNYVVGVEIAFKRMGEEQLALDYMQLQQNFDYYVDGIFANTVETKSFFTYYEYYEPPKRKRLGGRLKGFNQRDADALDAVGYNQQFWDDNIIVKRTPIEQEVINSFERERAFGSIYLNNTNQLVLDDFTVDNDPFIVGVRKKLREIPLPAQGEKLYIHHDKPVYATGEDMWFSAYVLNMATHSPSTRSKALTVMLKAPDGTTLVHKVFRLKDGFGEGRFHVPDFCESGEYQLVAFTERMQQMKEAGYFHKWLTVIDLNDNSGLIRRVRTDSVNSMMFFPEGGKLVGNLPSQVGFLARNDLGHGISAKGKLLNGQGRQVATIKSEFGGLGSLFVLPMEDEAFEAVISSDPFRLDSLPKISSSGYGVMVNNLKPNTVDLTIRGTPDVEGRKFYLLVIARGVLFDRRIGMLTRGLFKAEIPKSNLPTGIAQILLMDEAGNLLNKRLIFVRQPESAVMRYYLPKKDFKPREQVDMVIEVKDETGKPMSFADISVAVVDKDRISRDETQQNIQSYLYFDYLYDYRMDNSGMLFEDTDRERLKLMDYAMLSQKTTIPDIASFDFEHQEADTISLQKTGLELCGTAYNALTADPLTTGYLTFKSNIAGKERIWYAQTDHTGVFSLQKINFDGRVDAKVYAQDETGKPVRANLVWQMPNGKMTSESVDTVSIPMDVSLEQYTREMKKSGLVPEGAYARVMGTDQLKGGDEGPYGKVIKSIVLDDSHEQYDNLAQILKRELPGKMAHNDHMHIEGKEGPPLFTLDGLLLNSNAVQEDKLCEAPLEALAQISTAEIARIEIIPQPDIDVFGAPCPHGIVSIYSRQNTTEIPDSASDTWQTITLQGYEVYERFTGPDYGNDGNVASIDNRTTLYWNPRIQTNRKGRVKISFFNSDQARNMQICVEGISRDGVPIFDVYNFGRSYSRRRGRQ
jgi:hypothetical protein